MPPNVVWIMTDQHRLDCVGAYGGQPVHTPNLDRLAQRSVVFERHYSTCPLCVPARSSLHTGRFPHSCGAIINAFGPGEEGRPGMLNPDEVTIGDLMHEAGYRVGHVGVNHVRTEPPMPKRDAFSTFISNSDYGQYVAGKGLQLPDMRRHQHECPTRFGDEIRSHFFSAPNPGRHPFEPDDFLDFYFARHAAEVIRQAPDNQPYFAMAFLWMPHPPFVIPEPYYSMYSPDDIVLPDTVGGPQDGKPRMHLDHLPGQVGANHTPQEWREAWAAYFGCVTLVDTCIGLILDAIDDRNGSDETIIVFHPDHGEMLGVHSYFQKMVCYEESIHVPMMISAPGVEPGRRDCLTSHVDILPTILDCAGVDVPAAVQGNSLRPVLEGTAQSVHDAVFSEYNGNVVPDVYQRCVVSGTHKYIWNDNDIDELYDLYEDPAEQHNIAQSAGAAELRHNMREMLGQWVTDTGDFITLD